MSKKLLCLLLCLLMVAVPLLASCESNKEEAETGEDLSEEETVSRDPMTLSLWVPTGSETTKESIELVEAQLNSMLSAKFNTNIELNAIPEDEYEAAVSSKLNSIDEVKKAAEEAAESERLQKIEDAENGIIRDDKTSPDENAEEAVTEAEGVETYIDEYGQAITVYPDVADDQLDIFLVKGYDDYTDYIADGLIKNLDEDMSSVGYKLYSYIYPTFFDLAKVEGSLYGIPNNKALGEYQFLLINKELVEKYDYSADELTSLVDCEDFIMDIGSQNLEGVTPLLGEAETPNMVFFSATNEWSIISSQITSGVTAKSRLDPSNTLDSDYVKNMGLMKRLAEKGYIGDGVIDEGETFAVGIVKGDASLVEQYSDEYYVSIHGAPYADIDDVFSSVFCISEYTKDSRRAMEVITYLNTDEEFRTVLQYGVEGHHWAVDKTTEEKTIKLLRDDYVMNINDLGNAYVTYPAPGVPMSFWSYSMQQNLDSSTNPYIGFEYINDDNKEVMDAVAEFSKRCYEALLAAPASEFTKVVANYKREFNSDPVFKDMFTTEASDALDEPFLMTYELYYKSK